MGTDRLSPAGNCSTAMQESVVLKVAEKRELPR